MNGMMSINCEGDVEAFVRKGLDLMTKDEPSTLQLNVPNEWWAQYCINIFSSAVDSLPSLIEIEEDSVVVDIIFNVGDGSSNTNFDQLSKEEIQDLIDDFIKGLENEGDDDDDDDDDS